MKPAKITVTLHSVLLFSSLCASPRFAFCQSKSPVSSPPATAGCPGGFSNPVVPNGCPGQFRHGTPVFKDAAGNLSVATASHPVTLTHPGVDLVAPCEVSPIYPVSDGTVEKVINSPSDPSWGVPGKKGLGYAVLVHHSRNTGGKQTYSLYLHMNKPPEVTAGQRVSGGKTRLGFVGETGAAWGCHTHFEIRHFSSFVLSDARWSSPPNIYGAGDKRATPVLLENWENPFDRMATSAVSIPGPKLPPVDQGPSDPSFASFRQSLMSAVRKQDKKFLVSILAPDIQVGFGSDPNTPASFQSMWRLDQPNSPLWVALGNLLDLGGSFRQMYGRRYFCAPYVSSVKGGWDDPFNVFVVLHSDVDFRAQASDTASLIGKLSYNIVQPAPWPWRETDASGIEWGKVVVNSKTGYVRSEYLYSPVGYRACFRQEGGRWLMSSLVSGD